MGSVAAMAAAEAIAKADSENSRITDRLLRDEDEEDNGGDVGSNPVDDGAGGCQVAHSRFFETKDQRIRRPFEGDDGDNRFLGEETDSACEDMDEPDGLEDPDSAGKESSPSPPWIPLTLKARLKDVSERLPPRLLNVVKRCLSGSTIILLFATLVSMGPFGLNLLTLAVLWLSHNEVLRLGMFQTKVSVSSGRLSGVIYKALMFFYIYVIDGKAILGTLATCPGLKGPLTFAIRNHNLLVFSGSFALMLWFLGTLKNNYLGRYAMFFWANVSAALMGLGTHCITYSMMKGGLFFYIFPMTVITANDIAAYFIGFTIGKTPLINISPKKTLEGYVLGGVISVIFGVAIAYFLPIYYPYLICPVQINNDYFPDLMNTLIDNPTAILSAWVSNKLLVVPESCTVPVLFTPYSAHTASGWSITPFMYHGTVLSIFTSYLGPVGGFFASGFKRACKCKNFGSLIPGHGGVLDRCDCMILMAITMCVYTEVALQEGYITGS